LRLFVIKIITQACIGLTTDPLKKLAEIHSFPTVSVPSTVRVSGLGRMTEDTGVLQEARSTKAKIVLSKSGQEKQTSEGLLSQQFYPVLLNAKSPLKHLFPS